MVSAKQQAITQEIITVLRVFDLKIELNIVSLLQICKNYIWTESGILNDFEV
jgi:hypothetical protein